MKALIIFAILGGLNSGAFAQSSTVLSCHVSNPEATADFVLDAVGAGTLSFKKNGKAYDCKLKIRSLEDGERDVAPNITVRAGLKSCAPALGDLEDKLTRSITLIVDISKKEKPHGRLQWLTEKQPDACAVTKVSLFDLSRLSKSKKK